MIGYVIFAIAAIAYNLATLVFQRRKLVDSLKWLKRRFYRVYEDILMNTPFTQEFLRMGRDERREEEHEKTLRMTHKTVTRLVQLRFPEIVEQAKNLVEQIKDAEQWQQIILDITIAHNAAEVINILSPKLQDK